VSAMITVSPQEILAMDMALDKGSTGNNSDSYGTR
jgi:hypothetical protein